MHMLVTDLPVTTLFGFVLPADLTGNSDWIVLWSFKARILKQNLSRPRTSYSLGYSSPTWLYELTELC